MTMQSDIMEAKWALDLYNTLTIINVFLCLARILKFFDAQGRLAVINGTFANAAMDLAHFILMLGSVLSCFSFFGYLTFVPKLNSYTTN
eukprot:SAG22_NODE_4756_length_1173_cov_1.140596_1_plen_88_part_10